MNNRKYNIYYGSRDFFYEQVSKKCNPNKIKTLLEKVKENDANMTNGFIDNVKEKSLLIPNDNYNGITEQALDRLLSLIEDLTELDAKIYIHNPPMSFMKNISNKNYSIHREEYKINFNEKEFNKKMNDISTRIIGQQNAIQSVGKSLLYLCKKKPENPYVIMLYGNSSLGKTELVHEIANQFFDGNYFEKHLSMFQNDKYSNYFFGDSSNRKTLTYDLLERKSNLIFFDEIDKCHEMFYTSFYSLFDNKKFKDITYEVDTTGLLIILTANFSNKQDMMKKLGAPIFYRIDKFIHFSDFSPIHIKEIFEKEIKEKSEEFLDLFTIDELRNLVYYKLTTKENARTIKIKVQHAIEELLYKNIGETTDN